MRRLSHLLLTFLIATTVVACGKKAEVVPDELADLTILQTPGRDAGISGYNEPLDWQAGIGVRAVANGDLLMISVRNNSPRPIAVEPEAFRLILPESRELRALDRTRDDLSGFAPRRIAPGGRELFTARLSRIDELVGMPLVFQYPPENVRMRLVVESTAD
jgi:hypothetical protein